MAVGLVQGQGEGPNRILAGTKSGSICMWECAGEQPSNEHICWDLGQNTCRGVAVQCLAAVDQVVVSGLDNGAMRIIRVDTHLGQPPN